MEEDFKSRSKKIRRLIFETAFNNEGNSSHIGGAFSIVEILNFLYFHKMQITDHKLENRDRLILSKGHACLGLYCTLVEKGIMPKEQLKNFEKINSKLLGHPVMDRSLGIEFSNGSLGMGLSLGIGVAISFKKKNIDNKIYVLLGDGECAEGSIWEALSFISYNKLKNIITIVDRNNLQQTGKNEDILSLEPLSDKFKSFGFDVKEIDGHSFKDLEKTFVINNKPLLILAKTIKGKGFSVSENNNDWHHTPISNSLFEKFKEELSIG